MRLSDALIGIFLVIAAIIVAIPLTSGLRILKVPIIS